MNELCRLPGMAAETAHGHEGGGIKQKAKEVWHGIKEITPGTKVGALRCTPQHHWSHCVWHSGAGGHTGTTMVWPGWRAMSRHCRLSSRPVAHMASLLQEHRTEFGTDVALGGYRSQMGKR